MDSALGDLQGLICHKTQTSKQFDSSLLAEFLYESFAAILKMHMFYINHTFECISEDVVYNEKLPYLWEIRAFS